MNDDSKRYTRKVKLVETNNLALAFRRLRHTQGISSEAWKRALLHALAIGYTANRAELERVRIALELP